jgi:localization factor PodJL
MARGIRRFVEDGEERRSEDLRGPTENLRDWLDRSAERGPDADLPRQRSKGPASRATGQDREDLRAVANAVNRLVDERSRAETGTGPVAKASRPEPIDRNVGDILETLDQLDRRLKDLATPAKSAKPEPAAAPRAADDAKPRAASALRQAIAEIQARQSVLDADFRKPLVPAPPEPAPAPKPAMAPRPAAEPALAAEQRAAPRPLRDQPTELPAAERRGFGVRGVGERPATVTRQDQARLDRARQDQARQDQSRQDQARQEQARQEQAAREQARQEELRREALKPVAPEAAEPNPKTMAEIERQFRRLTQQIEGLPQPWDQTRIVELFQELRRIRMAVEERGPTRLSEEDLEEIRAISLKVDAATKAGMDADLSGVIVNELAALRGAFEQSDFGGSVRRIELSYDKVAETLESLRDAVPDGRVIDQLGDSVLAVKSAVEQLPDAAQIARIERRFTDMADHVGQIEQRLAEGDLPDVKLQIAEMRTYLQDLEPSALVRQLDQRFDTVVEKIALVERQARGPLSVERLTQLLEELRTIATGNRTIEEIRGLDRRFAEINRRLGEIEKRSDQAEISRVIAERIQALGQRLDQIAVASGGSAVIGAEVNERLHLLSERIEDLGRRGLDTETVTAIGDALRRIDAHIAERTNAIAARIDRLEVTSRTPDLSGMETRLAETVTQVVRENAAGPELDEIATLLRRIDARLTAADETDRFAGLELNISDIAQRLAALDPSETSAEVVGLAREVGLMRRDIEGQIGQRLDQLARAIANLPTGQADEALIRPIEVKLARIAERLDYLSGRPSEIVSLSAEISSLRREVTATADNRPEGGLGARLDRLTELVERQGRRGPDERALLQIEEKLSRLTRQVESTDSRFAGLEAIEDSLARIQSMLADGDSETLEAARETARDTVREYATLAEAGGSAEAIESLREELQRLREGARAQESATTGTLNSVHDALTSVVGRLRNLEEPAAAKPSVERKLASFQFRPTGAADTVAPAAPAEEPTVLLSRREIDENQRPDDEDTRPIEPGIGRARPPRPAAAPAAPAAAAPAAAKAKPETAGPELDRSMERPGFDRPAFAGPRPAAPDAPSPLAEARDPVAARRADFIAAARRAAQAAKDSQPVPSPSALSGMGFGEDAGEPGPGALARIGAVVAARKRPLMLSAAAVVIAIFALQAYTHYSETVASLGAGEPAPIVTADTPKLPADGRTTGSLPKAAPAAPATGPATGSAGGFDATLQPPSGPTTSFNDPVPPAPSIAMPPLIEPPRTDVVRTDNSRAAPEAAAPDPLVTSAIKAPPRAGVAGTPGTLPEKIGSAALRQAALAGDAKAQFEIGLRYTEGRGVAADPAEAATWYRRAADQGLIPAQYRLGSAYEKGHTGTRDTAEAKRWYVKAAEAGNLRAMHNLGVLYANDGDMANALAWFQKAGDAGVRDSQFNLGIIHALGSGVKQDLAIAYKWFALAAAQGDDDAAKKRDDVAKHLDAKALAGAKLAVSTFRPKPADRAANEETAVWAEPGTSPAAADYSPDTITRAQTLLQSQGLYAGPIDGKLSEKTKLAIRAYQRKLNLKPTGEPDAATLQALAGKQA